MGHGMETKRIPTGIQCPECRLGQLVAMIQTEEFVFDLGDEVVKVRALDVPVEKCDRCGEELSGPAAAKVRHEAICRAAGLLTPSEIKNLRERFGWLQQYLADLTDFGVATISRWERGRLLQNRSANKVLLALRDCPPFREYLQGLLVAKASKKEPDLANANGMTPRPVNRVFRHIDPNEYSHIRGEIFMGCN